MADANVALGSTELGRPRRVFSHAGAAAGPASITEGEDAERQTSSVSLPAILGGISDPTSDTTSSSSSTALGLAALPFLVELFFGVASSGGDADEDGAICGPCTCLAPSLPLVRSIRSLSQESGWRDQTFFVLALDVVDFFTPPASGSLSAFDFFSPAATDFAFSTLSLFS